MFQYAFLLKLKSAGWDCKMFYDNRMYIHNGIELERAFGIKPEIVAVEFMDKLLDKRNKITQKVLNKLGFKRDLVYWEHDKGYKYKSAILTNKNYKYLQGCWLSEKYFSDISSEVRNTFIFRNGSENTKEMAKIIKEDSYSVSIHIRRGDYLKSNNHLKLNYNQYIIQALSRLDINRPSLYVFSDDKKYIKEFFSQPSWTGHTLHFIDWNNGKDSWQDMFLMSLCKNNIICNSTFSWWAAWLNKNPDKMVVCPRNWFTSESLNDNDIVPESWIKI